MKKLLALLLAMVMVIGITACGKTENPVDEDPVTEQTENVTSDDKNEVEDEIQKEEEKQPSEKPAETPAEKPTVT